MIYDNGKALTDMSPGGIKQIEMEDGKLKVKRVADVSKLIQVNHEAIMDNPKGYVDKEKTMQKVATIPLIVLEMWKKQYGFDYMGKKRAVLYNSYGSPVTWERISKEEAFKILKKLLRNYTKLRTSKVDL